MKKSTIYTGTGDAGSTSLIGNVRVRKDHPRVEAYGTLDELNAHIGLLAASIEDCDTVELLQQIENSIMTLGSYLATEGECECPIGREESCLPCTLSYSPEATSRQHVPTCAVPCADVQREGW